MNLATIILLIMLGMIIGMAFCKSPQRKYTYSGDARKKKLIDKKDTDTFQSGDLLWYGIHSIGVGNILGVWFVYVGYDEMEINSKITRFWFIKF